MKIVVCYKCVPGSDTIAVNGDRSLSFKDSVWEIGQYDLQAIEAGARLCETAGGSLAALTAGGAVINDSKLRKAVLSRGPEELFAVDLGADVTADSYKTASILAQAVRKIGGVDLVLCGEGSSDMYVQQVGNLLGALLGWCSVNAVSAVSMQEDKLLIERSLENSVEVLRLAAPAVLSMTSDANTPRIPNMKEILKAGKKPVTVWPEAELGGAENASGLQDILAQAEHERQRQVLEGATEENLARFIGILTNAL